MRIDGIEFLARALQHNGKPYIWAAKGPDTFDCSGLVTYSLKECGGPDWRETHNAALLFDTLDAVHLGDTPSPGCLVFYGHGSHATHVMVLCPDGRVYGASGGNAYTLTLADAERSHACVRHRDSVAYRKDCIGFRRLPEALHG